MKRPRWVPDEEGWVWDRKVLHTLFAFDGVQVGDELLYKQVQGVKWPVLKAVIKTADHRSHLKERYGNPRLAGSTWRILAWRRP